MRLFERANPSDALFLDGGVTVHFTQPTLLEAPKRTGSEITFPFHRGIEIYQLRDKKSCLIVTKMKQPTGPFSLWFCGTDEAPFLTELKLSCFSAFVADGEGAFYESLKPEWLKRCEKHYGVEARRQGDIYACEMPGVEWSTLKEMHLLGTGEELNVTNDPPNGNGSIFETNHRFVGYWAKLTLFGHKNVSVGSGIIEATPDHKQLILEKPHIVCQSAGVVNPKGD